jgi:hypothetical protein
MVKPVFRDEILKAEVEGVDLNDARAKVRDAEAILRLFFKSAEE